MGMTPQRLLCTLKGSGSGSLRSTPYCVLIQESSLMWVLHTTFPLLDFQKSPSSDFIWRGTKDFSHLIGASFTDGKTGRCAWTNQSSSQEPLGIELSLTRTKRIETWIAVQIPTWGRLRKRWKMLLSTGYFTEAYLSGRDIFLSAPTGAGKRLTFWAGSIHFRSFIWGGLLCHRVCDCSVDFFNERSGLKPNSRGIGASSVGDKCSAEHLNNRPCHGFRRHLDE